MRKPETISMKEHTQVIKEHAKVIEKKNALITELANIVDEFQCLYQDYAKDLTPILERAGKATRKKAVIDVAWPPRKRIGEE